MSYLQERIFDGLGITKKQNEIKARAYDITNGWYTFTLKIFDSDKDDNIVITPFNLNGEVIQHNSGADPENAKFKNKDHKILQITRYKTPVKYYDKQSGKDKEKKYDIPAKARTAPFFFTPLKELFDKKEKIPTLILTEGYIKAAKACMHGIPCIGLTSITHVKDKETETMYSDVLRLIKECNVDNVIMLYDGDCRDISLKALSDGNDLYNRPAGFIASASKVRDLLYSSNVSIYFGHVQSTVHEDRPKGLDDILCTFKDSEDVIAKALLNISAPNSYFHVINITKGVQNLYSYFNLSSKEVFYEFHKHLIKEKQFQYRKTIYRLGQDQSGNDTLIKVKDKNLDNFFRVGDTYFEWFEKPTKYGTTERVFERRNKETITDDFGKNTLADINKYKAFCNVPDNMNYANVISNCFNLYAPFEHSPEPGEWEHIEILLRHVFGDQYEMALDYIQLLYLNPVQRLPILCLVSKENKTGKSTFVNLINAIFTQNIANVGNNDFANDFNSFWISKLVVICEESLIEKKQTIERIKDLSTKTAPVALNRKGKDQERIDTFVKFILCSNNEESFIYASREDLRYWVIKVPPIPKENKIRGFDDKWKAEIPAFLYFLKDRKMSTNDIGERMWFDPASYRTKAFEALVKYNEPRSIKEIRDKLREWFVLYYKYLETYDREEKRTIMLSAELLNEVFLKGRENVHILSRHIREYFKVDYYKRDGVPVTKKCKIFNQNSEGETVTHSKTIRPFVFYIDDFCSDEEIKSIEDTLTPDEQHGNYEKEDLPY